MLVLMGVSGSGKTTVAALLAGQLGWDLLEGDDLHPAQNVAKMAAGHALDDEDRWPWLARIARWMDEHLAAGRPGIVTCSALKRSYRDVLRRDEVTFVLLSGSAELIRNRMLTRHGHFMPAELLDSQLGTLEPPGADEQAITVDVSAGPTQVAEEIVKRLQLHPTAARTEGDSA